MDEASGTGERLPAQRLAVGQEWAGSRLDRWLREQLPGLPPAALQRWLRTGQVRLNGGRVKGGERLTAGDLVRLPPMVAPSAPAVGDRGVPAGAVAELARRILWRDGQLLVVDKPAGMAVHGGSGQPWGVVDALRVWGEGAGERPELVHRLDRDTSGCLVLGLDRPSVRALAAAFRAGTPEKYYLALVRGVPEPRRGRISLALTKGLVRGGERMVEAGPDGAPAVTEYRVEETWPGCALVVARLLTGRTHQIRVHFQAIGHPLAGDGKYGDPVFNQELRQLGLRRLFLHAWRLRLPHPLTGQPVAVEAPLAEALEQLLARLARRS